MTIDNIVRKNILKLKPYSSARSLATSGNVFLDANELPFDRFNFNHLKNINRYPEPQPKLILSRLAKKHGVSEGRIIMGRGLDEILECLFKVLTEPGQDSVVITPPTYGYYKVLADIYNIKIENIFLSENDFQLNVSRFLSLDVKPKIIFLCTPNNPTGNLLSRESILRVAEANPGSVIAIDEAYIDFSLEAGNLDLIDRLDNVIVLRTISKAYGAAGLRFGYGIGNEKLIAFMKNVIAPYPISSACIPFLERILRDDDDLERNMLIERLNHQKQILRIAFEKMSFIKAVYTSDANFILIKVVDATDLYEKLKQLGIIIRNRTDEPMLDNCVRISIGSEEENQRLLSAFENYGKEIFESGKKQ